MKSLHEYFLNNSGKVIHKWLHYMDIYERHFEKYVGKKVLIFEIGVSKGGSIEMWRNFFGENSIIVGIDIDPNCVEFSDPNNGIHVEIGDQSDVVFLDSLIHKYGSPDVVIDDGSHMMNDLCTTFEHLYNRLKPESTYLVEDLHTCYWQQYEGGLKRQGTFIELVKDKIDYLNAIYTGGALSANFAIQTQSISVYDSVVVFERKPQGRRIDLQTGGW